MNAVIYARYSAGPNQTEQSIEGQVRECEAFAKRQDLTIIEMYIDRSISGKTDNRPEFQRMIKESEKKQFEAVIVYRLDRFSRNRYDSAMYRAKLKKNGVKVLSAMENITDSPEGIILESLLEGMAEYYSAELSLKIRRGQKENALKCKATNGNTPLGYKLNNEKLYELDPVTAPIVKQIFEMYASGSMVKEITKELNSKGYRTAHNREFSKNSLARIFRNRKYIGVYEAAGIVIENGIPAIVSKELFESVQKRLKKNKLAPARRKSPVEYLLTTKLFCGKCGYTMAGESGTGRSDKYYYYACSNRKRFHACDKKSVKKDLIEGLVVQETVHQLLNDETISFIADRIVQLIEHEKKNDKVMDSLNAQKRDAEKSIANILKAIEQGIITDSTKQRLIELEHLKSDIEIQLVQQKLGMPDLNKEQIVFWISQFKNGNVNDVEYQKRIIDTFVNAVFVFDDEVLITYNYTDNQEQISLSVAEMVLVDRNGSSLDFVSPVCNPCKFNVYEDYFFCLLHFTYKFNEFWLFVKSCGFDIKSKFKNDFNQDNSQIDFWELF